MSELYLIRHGQATINSDNYDRLSDLGRQQASILGSHLAELGISFDAAYSGTLERQRHTGELVLAALGQGADFLQHAPAGNEYNAFDIFKTQLGHMRGGGPVEDHQVRELAQDRENFRHLYEQAMLRWLDAGPHEAGPETWLGFQERVGGLIKDILAREGRGKRVALFTSGGPISAAMRLTLELPDQVALRLTWQVRNSSVTVLRFDGQRLSLECFNSVAHLQATGRPELITRV
ncbi:MAG: histidine phosphatase family protein [Pseudomonadota bacterium]